MNAATDMPTRARSRRSFAQALRQAGLEPPAVRRGTEAYLKQRGELMLQLLVLGIEHRLVGSGAWYCAPLGGLDGHEPL